MYKKYIKRIFDIIISGLSFVILLPLFIVIAFVVKINLGTPVIFKQKRPGIIDKNSKKESVFYIYKFRTMTDERDSTGRLLPDTIRLNRFGRILRSTSLDELPELINIIKGDMSIVGPRPLAIEYLPYYTNLEHHRHDVRPGLTGWAQVNGRNNISWEQKFKYDLEYIDNISFIFDIKIIFLTIKKVFIREGIGQGEMQPISLHIIRKDWLDENGNIKN